MSNYMSEYEEYYKNINKKNNENQKSRYLPRNQKNNNIYSIGRNDEQVNFFSKDYWIRKIIREVSCTFIILAIFIGLKYIKNDYVQKAYIWSRGIITSNFNYDETIEAFNNCEFGTFKISELNVGGFTVEDLKSDKINIKIDDFIDYLKNIMNTQKVQYILISNSSII